MYCKYKLNICQHFRIIKHILKDILNNRLSLIFLFYIIAIFTQCLFPTQTQQTNCYHGQVVMTALDVVWSLIPSRLVYCYSCS